MGCNSSIPSHVPVGRETVRVQYGSLLDAVLQGFPDVVAMSHHLLHARPVTIDGGDHGHLVPRQSTHVGFSSPARRSQRRRIASLPAATSLEALAEVRLVDLYVPFRRFGSSSPSASRTTLRQRHSVRRETPTSPNLCRSSRDRCPAASAWRKRDHLSGLRMRANGVPVLPLKVRPHPPCEGGRHRKHCEPRESRPCL